MVSAPEDWEKPRSRGQHLTAEEIQQLRIWYNCGERSRWCARELKCSTRTVDKYFGDFRGEPNRSVRKVKPSPKPVPKPVRIEDDYYFAAERPKHRFDPQKHRESRFYRGNFDL